MRGIGSIATLVLFLAAMSAGSNAHALTYQYEYQGVITSTEGFLTGVSVGTSFVGHIELDASTPSLQQIGEVVYAFKESGRQARMWAEVGGHFVQSSDLTVHIADGTGFGGSDYIHFAGWEPAVDGEFEQFASGDFALNFSSATNPGAVTGLDLPTNLDVSAFDQASGRLYLYRPREPIEPTIRFSVSQFRLVTPVPEPETWGLMLAGLGLLGVNLKRRSKREAVQA